MQKRSTRSISRLCALALTAVIGAGASQILTTMPAEAGANSGEYVFVDSHNKRNHVHDSGTGWVAVRSASGGKWHWYGRRTEEGVTVYRQCGSKPTKGYSRHPSAKKCHPFKSGRYRFFGNGVAIWWSNNKRIGLVRSDLPSYGWTGEPVTGHYSETGKPNSDLVREFRTRGSGNELLQYRFKRGNKAWTSWSNWTLVGGTTYVNDKNTQKFSVSDDNSSIRWDRGKGKDEHFYLHQVDHSAPAAGKPGACDGIPINIEGVEVCIGIN